MPATGTNRPGIQHWKRRLFSLITLLRVGLTEISAANYKSFPQKNPPIVNFKILYILINLGIKDKNQSPGLNHNIFLFFCPFQGQP